MNLGNMSEMEPADKPEEECGVFGMFSPKAQAVAENVYLGILALQHRGQESAGISISQGEEIQTIKGMGLASTVFKEVDLPSLKGCCSIGHVRYSTTGDSRAENAHPLEGRCKLGRIALAHNGNLINTESVRALMEDAGTLFQTGNDTEVILHLISRKAAEKGIEKAIEDAVKIVKGSYALVMIFNDTLYGIRDPYGIRPLCIGKRDDSYFLSSESCALDAVGGEWVRDVAPGEIVAIDKDGLRTVREGSDKNLSTCVFEYIYFARPDSYIDGIYVNEVRERCGMELWKQSPVKADIVIGVPDSGIPAALGYSMESGIPFRLGFIKNRYVGRTFITPSQEMRERAVQLKLSALKNDVKGKSVILIDDSIVRGTTSKRLIQKMRDAGAKEVHFGVVSPPVTDPCYFGIDTPYAEDLLANKMDNENIRKVIGADSLSYLSIEGLKRALKRDEDKFCFGCFSGKYPISPN